MRTIKLESKGNKSLIAIMYDTDDYIKEYAVVYYYDKERHFGEQWRNGNYFKNIFDALNYFYQDERPNYYRLEEIASHALHYIEDGYNELLEFEEEYDINFTEEELLYFGLDNYIDLDLHF